MHLSCTDKDYPQANPIRVGGEIRPSGCVFLKGVTVRSCPKMGGGQAGESGFHLELRCLCPGQSSVLAGCYR